MVQAPTLASLNTAEDVVQADLTYICKHLSEEFATFSGKNLLITGGAGFLGYYLVQSVLHWNEVNPTAKPIRLTIYDNYIRGVPEWLTSLSDNPNLKLLKHDITNPSRQWMPTLTGCAFCWNTACNKKLRALL